MLFTLVYLQLIGHLRLGLLSVDLNVVGCFLQLIVPLGLCHLDLVLVLSRDFLLHCVGFLQRHRDTETQRHRDTETQRHRDTETTKQQWTSKKTWSMGITLEYEALFPLVKKPPTPKICLFSAMWTYRVIAQSQVTWLGRIPHPDYSISLVLGLSNASVFLHLGRATLSQGVQVILHPRGEGKTHMFVHGRLWNPAVQCGYRGWVRGSTWSSWTSLSV